MVRVSKLKCPVCAGYFSELSHPDLCEDLDVCLRVEELVESTASVVQADLEASVVRALSLAQCLARHCLARMSGDALRTVPAPDVLRRRHNSLADLAHANTAPQLIPVLRTEQHIEQAQRVLAEAYAVFELDGWNAQLCGTSGGGVPQVQAGKFAKITVWYNGTRDLLVAARGLLAREPQSKLRFFGEQAALLAWELLGVDGALTLGENLSTINKDNSLPWSL